MIRRTCGWRGRLDTRRITTRGLCLSFIGLVSFITIAALPAAEFRIHAVRLADPGRLRLDVPSDPTSYFILFQGATVQSIRQASQVRLGDLGTLTLETDIGGESASFHRLAQQPVQSPLDIDHDGIDDVFELHHPRSLNPLDPADASQDFDGDGASNLAEYRSGTDPEMGPWSGSVFYVVDDPPLGSTTHFRTLAEVLHRLGEVMPAHEAVRVVVATDRPQNVESFNLLGGIELEVGEGHTGRAILRGPGDSPLAIQASAGFDLRGFEIQNAGGFRVSAAHRITLRNNRLPTTTVSLASPATGPRSLHGGAGPALTMADCRVAGALRLDWFGSAGAGAQLGITGNHASVIEATVRGLFGGSAEIRGNVADNVSVGFEALAAGSVALRELTEVQQLNFSAQATGNPTLSFSQILAGAVTVEFGGVGSVFASFEEITTHTFQLDLGAARSDTSVSQLTVDDMILEMPVGPAGAPRVRHRQQGVNAKGGIRINAWEAKGGELDLSLAAINASTLELQTRASTTLQLNEQVTLTGQLKASVDSDILTFNTVQARLEGGLELRATGLAAGVSGFWQGGSVRGNTDLQCGHGVWVGITVDGTAFEPGGVFHLHEEAAPFPLLEGAPGPIIIPRQGPLPAGDRRTFQFRNIEQAPRELLIAGIESGVTLQQCSFHGTSLTPSVILEDVEGPIRVEDCRFTGQGLGISDARDAVVLAGNRFALS
ncbi:MAG: hypothetical protein JNK85_14770, partial [Verrucomicrobiales bacterium]|nr:hypothetical protein [Verrucomicrobiales bacterium]